MSIAGEPWQFTIQGVKISCNFKGAIKEQTHGNKAQVYWEQKKRFNDGTADDVDWQTTEETMKSMQQHRQHWLSKHTSGFCGTGKMMVRRKERTSAKCPRCDYAVEDSKHVLQCRGIGTEEVWNKQITEVKAWMENTDTEPTIQHALLAGVHAWRQGEPNSETDNEGRQRRAEPKQDRLAKHINFLIVHLPQKEMMKNNA